MYIFEIMLALANILVKNIYVRVHVKDMYLIHVAH